MSQWLFLAYVLACNVQRLCSTCKKSKILKFYGQLTLINSKVNAASRFSRYGVTVEIVQRQHLKLNLKVEDVDDFFLKNGKPTYFVNAHVLAKNSFSRFSRLIVNHF